MGNLVCPMITVVTKAQIYDLALPTMPHPLGLVKHFIYKTINYISKILLSLVPLYFHQNTHFFFAFSYLYHSSHLSYSERSTTALLASLQSSKVCFVDYNKRISKINATIRVHMKRGRKKDVIVKINKVW